MDVAPRDCSDTSPSPRNDDDVHVYCVPYRWWKEAEESTSGTVSDWQGGILYTASPTSSGPMKLINSIFSSDIVFNLRREDDFLQDTQSGEVGISGRDYALVPGEMWLQALKWHNNSKAASKNGRTFLACEDDMSDIYPLQLRLSTPSEDNLLGVRISKKDNATECFRRACKIFSIDSEILRIWDFSGKTTQYFLNDKDKGTLYSQMQVEQDILLKLQVYGLSDSSRNEIKKDEMTGQHPNATSLMINSDSGKFISSFVQSSLPTFGGNTNEAGSLGLTGLQNLGNTCFMNSALQCLGHTPKLVDYFLGDYRREINYDNPLGMNGEIASAFGELLKQLWAPGATPVAPRTFKSKLSHFAPQFSGFNQHDSQELLAFLLDGLHEDVNRVKNKPYAEVKDSDGRPDEEVADEYWQNHLARNDSIIVDLCQGQYRSTLVCPLCRKSSITFDPFMYVSLPLPSTSIRTMTVTVMTTDGSSQQSSVTITVPKNGKLEDLNQALGSLCSIGVDETLLVVEVYNNKIIRYLEDPSDSLSLIRDEDRLVAYRLPKDFTKLPLIVFMHQQMEENNFLGKKTTRWKAFGIPLLASCSIANGSDIRALYLKLVDPYLDPADNMIDNYDIDVSTANEGTTKLEDTSFLESAEGAVTPNKNSLDMHTTTDFNYYRADEKGTGRGSEIEMNEQITCEVLPCRLNVIVCWPENMVARRNTLLLSSLPETYKSGFFSKKPKESVSLYKCLEAFLKEEPLGPEDMWYCPVCKKHCQASKKLDLWRLPEILVIHLKRFSYSRFLKNKLETYVEFPVHDLDLSSYISFKSGDSSNCYMLYAISNHYGSMGGGHYTAFIHHGGNRWFDFD
ncbi:hypothetical protein AG4045_022181 [Apium graveolens]|uniref:Ubiquitin carboxyl-terminal hydrolase n=1 Tax=Apium graveolens TaxID=4045 RepID=A0A6L5B8F1_APIGR|nr:hypothetical protein AG4045_022181 [Apium graveolens]